MKALFIDTSSKYLSLSIYDNNELVYSNSVLLRNKFNEELLSNIDFAFNILNIKNNEIDQFYVIVGPGSFTGIRIGVSAVLGLSLSTGKRPLGITSLDAAALVLNLFGSSKEIAIATKLRLNEYAFRRYNFYNKKCSDYLILKKEELPNDCFILGNEYLDLTRSYQHCLFENYLRGYEPFYMRKSQAEINFDKTCSL